MKQALTVRREAKDWSRFQAWSFHGMRASILLLGQSLAMRTRVWVNQAFGSTLFIFAVCRSVAIGAQLFPPPPLPANSEFCRVMACCRIAHSTMLESSSMWPSVRKRSKMARRAVA